MKAKHLIILSFLTILCTSCDTYRNRTDYSHHLRLSFQDVSGNDLFEGIDTVRWVERHMLGLVYSEPCMYPFRYSNNDLMRWCSIQDLDDRYYLVLEIISNKDRDCPNTARILTLQLRCPHIFGDNDIHEIETCWIQKNQTASFESECYRIVIDGKEITNITYKKHKGNFDYYSNKTTSIATITLEK